VLATPRSHACRRLHDSSGAVGWWKVPERDASPEVCPASSERPTVSTRSVPKSPTHPWRPRRLTLRRKSGTFRNPEDHEGDLSAAAGSTAEAIQQAQKFETKRRAITTHISQRIARRCESTCGAARKHSLEKHHCQRGYRAHGTQTSNNSRMIAYF